MKVHELDELLLKLVSESDHPEVTGVQVLPTEDRPDNHSRLRIDFASGAAVIVMVKQVAGHNHADYEIPQGAP